MTKIEYIAPEIWNYVQQSSYPAALKVLESRYIFIMYRELNNGDTSFMPSPGGTFNLAAGQKAPVYPDYAGAFVYDTQYKRWGHYASNVAEPTA